MIITAPTALYISELPLQPSDVGNVTWLISSTDPPRAKTVVPILPQTEELKPLPLRTFDPSQREIGVGEYVFNVNFSSAAKVGLGNKQYEAGELLDFDIVDTAPPINTRLQVPDVVELQQNTNMLDLQQFGLDNTQIDTLETTTRLRLNQALNDLNGLVANINAKEVDIQDNQKLINEARKIAAAAAAVFASLDPIVVKLNAKVVDLMAQRVTLTSDLNLLNQQANAMYNHIITIKEIVR